MNKAFMKSVEAVIAIILFFSAYSIAGVYKNDSSSIKNPSDEISSLLSSLSQNEEFRQYVMEENIGAVSSIIKEMLQKNYGSKVEMSCSERFYAKNPQSSPITANITILKFLGDSANIQSIQASALNGSAYNINARNNYYSIELEISGIASNSTILLEDITLQVLGNESINESSIHLFIGDEEALIDIENFEYLSEPTIANITIKALVPYLESNSPKAHLFYANNFTGVAATYSELGSAVTKSFQSSNPQKSKAVEITFEDSLESNELKSYSIYHELNTNSSNVLPSNEIIPQIIAESEKNYYSSGVAPNYEAQSYYSIKSFYSSGAKNCAINLKVWSYE